MRKLFKKICGRFLTTLNITLFRILVNLHADSASQNIFNEQTRSTSAFSTKTKFSVDFVSSNEDITFEPDISCCSEKCDRKFSAQKIDEWKENSIKRTFKEKRQFFRAIIASYVKWNENQQKFDLDLYQDGVKICQSAFLQFHGISRYFLQKVLKEHILKKESELEQNDLKKRANKKY